jgi:hypothetical protein
LDVSPTEPRVEGWDWSRALRKQSMGAQALCSLSRWLLGTPGGGACQVLHVCSLQGMGELVALVP